jgi:hypothetical protein
VSASRQGSPVVGRWLAAAGVALALTAALPVLAQQPRDPFQDRQLAYDAAKSQYSAALDAWRVFEKQWNDAMEDHQQGKRAGDGDRENAALVRALDLARELDRSERRVSSQRAVLDGARTELLAALDARMEEAATQLAAARSANERAQLATVLRDYENQQQQIEAERDQPAVRLQLLYYPSIQFDPRDTPEDLTNKAQLLRRRAEQADSSLAQIDREIARLEGQVRRRRNVESLMSGVERFDGQPPLGAAGRPNPPGEMLARPDSAGVARPEVTPQQKLEQLQLLRGQLQDAKQQFLNRAGDFEAAMRRIG